MCSSNYVKNPHLPGVAVDELFHLGLNTNDDLKGTFGDVKVSCNNLILEQHQQCYTGIYWYILVHSIIHFLVI